MSSAAFKAAAGAAGIGGVTGGGILINNHLSNNRFTIKELISEHKTKVAITDAKCTSLLGEKVSGESDPKYREFLTGCTRDKKVGDLLKGFTLMPAGGDYEAKWKKRFTKYKQAKQGTTFPIKDVVLEDSDSENTEEHLKKLKDGCSNQWSKAVTGNEEQTYLDALKDWCSLEETKNDG
ncbi:hypothetical protein HF1_04350 [Mycoplasma haemofelis str. Langford 1]|uniref:Uncharacterized protein n=1 Tax=Mycoplasma haemofelis (strain Langford 1) TaxID=941640 RepID=E8ZH22_MYCHL|nr:hypothetical protein [Mycoplasma haemofelis]CBY92443.1 hypothetical protein HF1_04350 [Mycoplasma haemofelis str. Langford 1]